MGFPMCVPTFGNLRITGYVRLPEAYRSLSRLSSALSAKASTIRPYQHNQLASRPRVGPEGYTCIALHALAVVFSVGFLQLTLSGLL